MKKNIYFLLLFVFVACCSHASYAQNSDQKFHSVFILNFVKYIQWPALSTDFVIGVLGDADIIAELERSSQNKSVGGKKIIIRKLDDISTAGECHVLYIPNGKSKTLEGVLEKTAGRNTLVITEKNGLAKKGSGINFVLKDGRWKFELNKAATEKAGLKVSSDLLRLAIEV